jgi:hypothetical protein
MGAAPPRRIQRKRERGWTMPPNTVYVGRPSKWGNPFWHAQRFTGLDFALRCYRMAVDGYWNPAELEDMPDGPFHIATKEFGEWTKQFPEGARNAIQNELRGKNLACWCYLENPCHADILLEIANAEAE